MKSVLLLGQIMFYLRIFNSQAQLGTRDMQKLDFEKVVFTSKKPEFMIFDMLPKQPIILYCALATTLEPRAHLYRIITAALLLLKIVISHFAIE